MFRPHPVQGWAPDFLPQLTEDAFEARLVDRVVPIRGAAAIELARALAQKEGIFSGISGGAALAAALEVANAAPDGTTLLCMLPDTGERYLSTPLFDGIDAEMNEEEHAIERSAEADPAPAPPVETEAAPVDLDAAASLDGLLADPGAPVVMFSFEWCEFCWAVRKFFAHVGIRYRSIDLDAASYQARDQGGKLRGALTGRTGIATIPQVFVGGRFVGGAVDVLDAWERGELQPILARSRVAFDAAQARPARSFLPRWLQQSPART